MKHNVNGKNTPKGVHEIIGIDYDNTTAKVAYPTRVRISINHIWIEKMMDLLGVLYSFCETKVHQDAVGTLSYQIMQMRLMFVRKPEMHPIHLDEHDYKTYYNALRICREMLKNSDKPVDRKLVNEVYYSLLDEMLELSEGMRIRVAELAPESVEEEEMV